MSTDCLAHDLSHDDDHREGSAAVAAGPALQEISAPRTAVLPDAPTADAAELHTIAERIRRHHSALNTDIFAIGRDLNLAKTKLRVEKTFTRWVRTEFTWSPSSAHRYMRAARTWGDRAGLVSGLEATSIYLLTAKKTPEAARLRVERALEAGPQPSAQQIREWVQAAKDEEAEGEEEPKGKAQAREAAALILENIGEAAVRLRNLMKGADRAELCKTLAAAPANADLL